MFMSFGCFKKKCIKRLGENNPKDSWLFITLVIFFSILLLIFIISIIRITI